MITVRHVDVVEYLSIGSLLQSGDIYEHVSMYQFQKRMLLVPFMHAPANLIGNLYLPAITPLVALSGVGLMVWLWVKGLRGRIKNKHALIALIVIGVALLVTNSRFIMHATYMNGHLASGILLMLIVGMIWLYVSGDRKRRVEKDGYITVALIALSVLVFARPEGFMMALLAIVPAIAGRGVATGHKALLLSVLGVAMIAWHGLLAGMYVIGGGGLSSISSSVYIPILLGSTLIIFALMLRRKIVGRYINKLPVVAEAGLWVLLGGLFVMNPHILLASVGATTVNVSIMSAWGVSWIILTGLVAYSLIFRKFKDSTYLRFSITTFVPLVLLLAYARDSPYRVAQADSLDRMWMQVIPVALLYIITAFVLGAAKGRSR